ncbi:hypothetical protein M901_2496, partial [Bacteriovorax sp. DB6_IX]
METINNTNAIRQSIGKKLSNLFVVLFIIHFILNFLGVSQLQYFYLIELAVF